MSREVRMVAPNWQHPRYPDDYYESHMAGLYVPLRNGDYCEESAEWDRGWKKWQSEPDPEYAHMRYTEYEGSRPSPDDYMPQWRDGEATHYMMYETTSEGTPISPAFSSPEELAAWLAKSGASAFGGMTATYEQWLNVARGAYEPSMVVSSRGLQSGVEASFE